MRLGVEPADLSSAAGAVAGVGERTRAARETLNRIDPTVPAWCPDAALASYVLNALGALEAAAAAAGLAADATVEALVSSAENYRRADRQTPQ